MIAFGVAISDREVYERVALPGIERAAEPGSALITRTGMTIWRAYDEILGEAATLPGLEALVLLHQDLELTDSSLPATARHLFRDPTVGLAGPLGARQVMLHLWQERRRLCGTVSAPGVQRSFTVGAQEVEAVDGALLLLAPWVARALRFGAPPAGEFHGYDVEIGLRVRAHGGRLLCADIPYFHHRDPTRDYPAQREAALTVARRWDPRLRPPPWASSFSP